MKRYNRYHACVYPDMEVMIPKEHGEWVKWEDVKFAVAYYEGMKQFEKDLMEGFGIEKSKGLKDSFGVNLTPEGVTPV